LDDAAKHVMDKAKKSVDTMKQKRAEHRQYIETVEEHKAKLASSIEQVQQAIAAKIEALKKMIDQKGEELLQQAKSVYTLKQTRIDGAVTRTKKRLAEFDTCLEMAEQTNAFLADNPTAFLRTAEDTDDEWRQCLIAPSPTAQPSWFAMPKPRFELVEDRLKHLKYKDRSPSTATLKELGIPLDNPIFDILGEMLTAGDDGYDSEGDYGVYSDEDIVGEEDDADDSVEPPPQFF